MVVVSPQGDRTPTTEPFAGAVSLAALARRERCLRPQPWGQQALQEPATVLQQGGAPCRCDPTRWAASCLAPGAAGRVSGTLRLRVRVRFGLLGVVYSVTGPPRTGQGHGQFHEVLGPLLEALMSSPGLR